MRNAHHLLPLLLACLLTLPTCMSMRVVAEYDSDNPVPREATRWVWVWGLIQPNDIVEENCDSICQVEVKTDLASLLVGVISLGLAVPMSVEYQCCAYDPGEGNL